MMLQNDNDNDNNDNEINDDMGEEELYFRLVAVQECGLKMLITSATLYHLLLAMILVFGGIDASRRSSFFNFVAME